MGAARDYHFASRRQVEAGRAGVWDICRGYDGEETRFIVRDMMFGLKRGVFLERVPYLECGSCGCLQMLLPAGLGATIPPVTLRVATTKHEHVLGHIREHIRD